MIMQEFKGNHFEIGKQQGKIYKKRGLNLNKIKVNENLLNGQVKIYTKHYPNFLEELKGIANGGNFDERKIISLLLTGEIKYYSNKLNLKQACTIFGVKNNNGVFVGRNLDWIPATEQVIEVFKSEPLNYNKFIGISDMWIVSEEDVKNNFLFYDTIDVINEKGLFIGITFGYYKYWQFGLSWRDMSKLIIETCSTVDEALKVFEKVPLSCPKNFFIADKTGKMVVVEHTAKKYKVVYPKDNILIQTNHYIDSELAKEDQVLVEVPNHNTFDRYNKTLIDIKKKKSNFKLNNVIEILGNLDSCVCQYLDNIKTIWSLALDMKKSKYLIYTHLHKNRKNHKLIL